MDVHTPAIDAWVDALHARLAARTPQEYWEDRRAAQGRMSIESAYAYPIDNYSGPEDDVDLGHIQAPEPGGALPIAFGDLTSFGPGTRFQLRAPRGFTLPPAEWTTQELVDIVGAFVDTSVSTRPVMVQVRVRTQDGSPHTYACYEGHQVHVLPATA